MQLLAEPISCVALRSLSHSSGLHLEARKIQKGIVTRSGGCCPMRLDHWLRAAELESRRSQGLKDDFRIGRAPPFHLQFFGAYVLTRYGFWTQSTCLFCYSGHEFHCEGKSTMLLQVISLQMCAHAIYQLCLSTQS